MMTTEAVKMFKRKVAYGLVGLYNLRTKSRKL